MTMKAGLAAVALCGTLDIVYAIVTANLRGGSTFGVLRGVAAGPFGDQALQWGYAGGAVGLTVHFLIMGVMVAVYLWLAPRSPLEGLSPWLAGTLYGLATWCVMYLIVLPLRWPERFPQTEPLSIALSLFPHIALVGLPLAFLSARASMHERLASL